MVADPFFAQPFSWSKYKHLILEHYLRIWVYHLARRGTLSFVDTCAGAGVYEDGSPGSPVIAARWNDQDFMIAKDAVLRVHACEADSDAAAKLREALGPWIRSHPQVAFVYEGRFASALPAIITATQNHPAFYFIDPFGLKDITLDQLRPLLTARFGAPLEILLRVDPILLARFAGWFRGAGRTEKWAKTREGFGRLLLRLNIDTQELVQRIEGEGGEIDRMHLLSQYLEEIYERFAYVQLIAIRPSYHAEPKYFLVHGTDSPEGAALINDVVSRAEDQLFQDTEVRTVAATGQVDLFNGMLPRPLRWTEDQLRDRVDRLVNAFPQPISVIELRAELARDFGPDFRERDHLAAIKRVLAAGVIAIQGDTTKLTPKTLLVGRRELTEFTLADLTV